MEKFEETYGENELNRIDNPNWQYIGKLQNINIFNKDNQLYTLVKTNKTFFVLDGMITQPIHIGQTVKLSKRDNAVKIGSILFHRPKEHMINEQIEKIEDNLIMEIN